MKRFSTVAFLGLVATVTLVRAESIGGLVSNVENSIRSEVSGAENTLRRNMPRIRLPSDRPHLPNMPNMPDIHMPNMPNMHMPNMPDIHMPNMPNMPNIRMPNFNMPDMPSMPSMPSINIISRLRSELQALESDLSQAMPRMPSAQGMINRVRGMIRSLVPGM